MTLINWDIMLVKVSKLKPVHSAIFSMCILALPLMLVHLNHRLTAQAGRS